MPKKKLFCPYCNSVRLQPKHCGSPECTIRHQKQVAEDAFFGRSEEDKEKGVCGTFNHGTGGGHRVIRSTRGLT